MPKIAKYQDLTRNERAFVEAYVECMDCAEAARIAGYKKSSNVGSELLRRPRIKAYIAKVQKAAFQQLVVDKAEIIGHLVACATRVGSDFIDENGRIVTDARKLSLKAQAAIDGITQEVKYDKEGNEIVVTKLKLASKNTAIDMALKHLGEYKNADVPQVVNKVTIDLGQLYNSNRGAIDPVEQRIIALEQDT